jgi:serine/threonine-protein kinase TTK/MPS1
VRFARASRSSSVHRTVMLARNVHTHLLVFTNTHDPRYENEIDLLQSLQGNDHIITLVGWERKSDPSVLYIVMECGDADLCTALKNRKKSGLAIDENCQRLYWQQMLEAVQAIHAVNIVHSDLKPANFIFVKGVLKLIDFGIAAQVQDDHTSALRDSAVGTLNYMAPEAISNQSALPQRGDKKQALKIGPAADVWSLGCILCVVCLSYPSSNRIPACLALCGLPVISQL